MTPGTTPVLALAIEVALVAVAVAMALCGWRLFRGPGPADRLLALDTLYVGTVAAVLLLGLRSGSAVLFEAALMIALLGFVSTVALARHLARGRLVE